MSWQEFEALVEELAAAIDDDFDCLVCINRGGLVLGRYLSDSLNLPLAVISARFYETSSQAEKELVVDAKVSSTNGLGERILLVDDLVGSGETMRAVIDTIRRLHPQASIKTAALYRTAGSEFPVDYYAKDKHHWVVFPYEKCEYGQGLI